MRGNEPCEYAKGERPLWKSYMKQISALKILEKND